MPSLSDAPTVAVIGGSGFVGTAAAAELRHRGARTWLVPAPRLRWPGMPERVDTGVAHAAEVDAIAESIAGADVVVNAAGLPDGTAPASPALFGANALLPVLVSRACGLAGVNRFVHVSSAAVQGRLDLDESPTTAAFSPYSHSKALGERLLLAETGVPTVVFRPTWVHAPGRANTASLVRLARSRFSAVAGVGDAPTPQVLISDVAAAVAYLVLTREAPPPIVLQPPSGMTTVLLLRLLGGHEPRHLSRTGAAALARGVRLLAHAGRGANALARRLDMLLYGRHQAPGWLAPRGATGGLDLLAWQRLTAPSTVELEGANR
jgi:nucleoside-diphosphate-sugar epimerase